MIEPFKSGSEFLEDVNDAAGRDEAFHLWWLGQSGFLLQWRGKHLLFDPYLSDSLTRKYADTDKPHVRMTRLVVQPELLDFVEVVTSSHNHTDHLDADTLKPLIMVNPSLTLVVAEANRQFVADRLDIDPQRLVGLDDGITEVIKDWRISGVPAAHEISERDELGRNRFLGYVVEFGPWTLYHSGDTVRYEGMSDVLSAFDIDVALLPINGRAPERRVAGNLDGPEAARLARDIGARVVIPCHFEMFEFNTASPEPFLEEAEKIGQRSVVLRNGERWSCDLKA